MAIRGPLRCVLCKERFAKEAEGIAYFSATSTCTECYSKMAASPFQGPKGTCFGKVNKVTSTGKIVGFGYDPIGSSDCREICIHRNICPLFASGKIYEALGFFKTPFTGKTETAMRLLLKGTSRLKAKMLLKGDVREEIMAGKKNGMRWILTRTSKAYRVYWLKESK